MRSLRFRGYVGVPVGGYTVQQGGVAGLQYAREVSLGKPDGLAQSTATGTVSRANIGLSFSKEWVTLNGPAMARRGYGVTYTITNYGFKRVYNVKSDYGDVSISGDKITFVARFSGWVSFEVNGRVFNVRSNTDDIQPPQVSKIGYSGINGGTLIASTTPFRMLQNADTHRSSSFQISEQVGFAGDFLLEVDNNTQSKTAVEKSGFILKKTVYVRASYEGANLGMSEWGPGRKYRMPIAIANTAPALGSGILNPVNMTMVIPTGGRLRVMTDKGFDASFTANASVTIPAGSSVLTVIGKGGAGTQWMNPGQAYVAPYRVDKWIQGPVWYPPTPEKRTVINGATRRFTDTRDLQGSENGDKARAYGDEIWRLYYGKLPWNQEFFIDQVVGGPEYNKAGHYWEVTWRIDEVVAARGAHYINEWHWEFDYIHPGQPYVAPYLENATGPSATASVQGQVLTFAGGLGTVHNDSTKLHRLLGSGSGTGAGTISATPATVVVPTGGSLRVVSDGGFNQTYTANATISIPAGNSILTLEGKGGAGTVTTNPGQPLIEPSGPIYEGEWKWEQIHQGGRIAISQLPEDNRPDYWPDRPPTLPDEDRRPLPDPETFEEDLFVGWYIYKEGFANYSASLVTYQKVYPPIIGYENAGQPYIAPFQVNNPGPVASITLQSKSVIFDGGLGNTAAVLQSKFHYLTSDTAPNPGFGANSSVDRTGKFFTIGTPRSETTQLSQVGALAVFELTDEEAILRQRFFSENVPTVVSYSVPTGGSIRVVTDNGYDQTSTNAGVANLTATGLKSVKLIGKGGPGSLTTNPGQAYIAPSGPVNETVVTDVVVPEVPAHWGDISAPIPFYTWSSMADAELNRSGWLAGATSQQRRTATPVGVSPTDATMYGYTGYTNPWVPLVASYTTTKSEVVFKYWTNPGQPYIAPYSQKVRGESTVVTYLGKSVEFIGGLGGEANTSSQIITSETGLTLGTSAFITPDSNFVLSGAPNDANGAVAAGGLVFDFAKDTQGYLSTPKRVVPPTANVVANGLFGYQLCANKDGSRVFISAAGESAVYYFTRVSGTLVFKQRIVATDRVANDFFGENLACDDLGNNLIVGAPNKVNGSHTGAAYLFTTTNGETFAETKKFLPVVGGLSFFYDVKTSGELRVEQLDAAGVVLVTNELTGSGSVTLNTACRSMRTRGRGEASASNIPTTLTFDGIVHSYPSAALGMPTEVFTNIPRFTTVKSYGCDVDIDAEGTRVIIGASKATASLSEQGAVFVQTKSGTTWSDTPRRVSSEPVVSGAYGNRVAMNDSGLRYVVGDPGGHGGVGLLNIVSELSAGNRDSFNTFYTSPVSARNFGREVAISGDGETQLASNPVIDDYKGYVYVFKS